MWAGLCKVFLRRTYTIYPYSTDFQLVILTPCAEMFGWKSTSGLAGRYVFRDVFRAISWTFRNVHIDDKKWIPRAGKMACCKFMGRPFSAFSFKLFLLQPEPKPQTLPAMWHRNPATFFYSCNCSLLQRVIMMAYCWMYLSPVEIFSLADRRLCFDLILQSDANAVMFLKMQFL